MTNRAPRNGGLASPSRHVPGGLSTIGCDDAYPEERPQRQVTVSPFRLAVHPVTVGEFARFVRATGYTTVAEHVGSSAVFHQPGAPVDRARPDQWWSLVEGASWLAPAGRLSGGPSPRHDLLAADVPVTHIALHDALAYCAWSGTRLPSEVEWEHAARLSTRPPTWPLADDGQLLANVWIGAFPWRHDRPDPPGPHPVGSLGLDAAGFADLLGNVWEWTATPWDDRRHVIKGGSFLCSADYCARYRPSARLPQTAGEPACHLGFRVALDG